VETDAAALQVETSAATLELETDATDFKLETSASLILLFSIEYVSIYAVPLICHNGEYRATSQLF
jgi:hypothetical protein